MKRKTLLLAVTFALGLMSPLAAQTDVTSTYIHNPGFEAAEDPTTTGVGTVTGWERTTIEEYNWSGCNSDWKTEGERSFGIWKPAIDTDFELWQELTVPNGIYMLTVDMTVSKAGATSRVNGQRLFAGDVEDFYPLSAETPSDNGEPYLLSVLTTVTNGTLRVGVRTDGGTSSGIGWFKVDNFKLYAFLSPEDMIYYYQRQIQDIDNELISFSGELWNAGGIALLAEKDKVLEGISGSIVPEEYQTAIAELNALMKNAKADQQVFLKLVDLLNVTYSELLELNYEAGLADLEAAWELGVNLFDAPDTEIADIEKAIEDFNAAIIAYKVSGLPQATPENPVDVTFLVKNSNIDEGIVNWTLDGFGLQNTGNQYENFAGNFLEKWVSGPETLGDYSAYQTITSLPDGTPLPNGLYKMSAAVIATQQSNTEEIVTGALLYANTGTTEVYTEGSVGARFEVTGAAWGGALEIGMKTVNTTANWVGFDNVTLLYCGAAGLGDLEASYVTMLADAKALAEKDFLPVDEKALTDAISIAESSPRTTMDEIKSILDNLDSAVKAGKEANATLMVYKNGSYAKALEIAENLVGIYSEDISLIMATIVESQNDVLAEGTTTVASLPELTEELDNYLSFVSAYLRVETYGGYLEDSNLQELLAQVLAEQSQAVTDRGADAIESAKKAFKDIMSFCDSYTYAFDYATNNEYEEFFPLMEEQLLAVQTDPTNAPASQRLLLEFVVAKEYTDVAENTDMTWVIMNPGFESEEDESSTSVGTVDGWKRTTTDGYGWSACNGDWKTEGERSFGIWKAAIDSDFELSQMLVVPNGTYTVSVDMTVSKFGSTSRVNGQRLFAGETEVYYPEEAETPADNGAAYNLSSEVVVRDYKLDIGIRTNGGTSDGIGWFKVDNFKLLFVKDDVSVESINDTTNELVAFVENGFIVVPGAETFTVSTINGVLVSANAQLPSGTYIVKANGQVAKLIVTQ